MDDKVREAIINGDVGGAAKAYMESKKIGHDVEPLELRPEVREFAEAMENQLRKNEGKGGWKDCKLEYLRKRVHQEVDEFIDSLGGGVESLDEAADVAKERWEVSECGQNIVDVRDDGNGFALHCALVKKKNATPEQMRVMVHAPWMLDVLEEIVTVLDSQQSWRNHPSLTNPIKRGKAACVKARGGE